MRFAVIVPVLNPGPEWVDWLSAYACQVIQPDQALIIDSESIDGYTQKAADFGFEVIGIKRDQFNHGRTRQMAVDCLKPGTDVVVFMTQDAILADANALQNLLRSFSNPVVAAAYGRQLPHHDAKPLGAHARLFNYGETSRLQSRKTITEDGIKTCFISNSFAAYRVAQLQEVGGFPSGVILGEDATVAGRLVLKGYSIAYVSDALVYHSHDYSAQEEFKRYFDTGVFHEQEPWILKEFGRANGEGLRFVKSELRYIAKQAPWLLPLAFSKSVAKFIGYKLGRRYRSLSVRSCKTLSMHRGFWPKAN